MTHQEIMKIQRHLKGAGFDPKGIDGVLGPDTWAAMIAFKKSVGLSSRKLIGPKTKAALFKDIKPADLPPLALPYLRRLGMHERRDGPALMAWFKQWGDYLGNPKDYPWCAEAAENAALEMFPSVPIPFDNHFWARNWAKWGHPTPSNKPFVGAFMPGGWRRGGGHIGVVAEISRDGESVKLLGANQSDKIGFAWYRLDAFEVVNFRVAPSEVGKIYPPFGEMASVGNYEGTR